MSSIYVLQQPHISKIILLSGTPIVWLREDRTICPFGVFPCVEAIFRPIWANPCDEADYGLVGFSLVL